MVRPVRPVVTSGDVARLLDVDLKTVHNWVRQGHLRARRTAGGHMRFFRAEVVRFSRRFEYPVSKELAGIPLAGVMVSYDVDHSGSGLQLVPDASRAALRLAGGEVELCVLDLDYVELQVCSQLVGAVRDWPDASGMVLAACAGSHSAAARFVGDGGDSAVVARSEIPSLIRWLTGGAERPASLVVSER